jgi:hypothetical protein
MEPECVLECTLTPSPGPTWAVGGPVLFRLEVTSTDGYAGIANLQFPIN